MELVIEESGVGYTYEQLQERAEKEPALREDPEDTAAQEEEKAAEEARRKKEEEERLKREEEEREAEEQRRIKKENSWFNKFKKGLTKFGKDIVSEE